MLINGTSTHQINGEKFPNQSSEHLIITSSELERDCKIKLSRCMGLFWLESSVRPNFDPKTVVYSHKLRSISCKIRAPKRANRDDQQFGN